VYFELSSVNNRIIKKVKTSTKDIRNPIFSKEKGYISRVLIKNE